MTLTDLKCLYTTLNKRLLLFDSTANMLKQLNPLDVESFFLDPEYFNPLLSYKENCNIKRKLARLFNYNGQIAFGDLNGKFLYKRAQDDTEYTVGGMILKKGSHKYLYEFLPSKIKVTLKQGTKVISHFAITYTFEALLTYIYNKHTSFFTKNIFRVIVLQDGFKILISDPTFTKYDELDKIFKDLPMQPVSVTMLPVTKEKEVVMRYVLPD